ncbi:efflux transporter outer membrane subunit [Plesiomonas shigelloides]|uniref:efflux transporter outer membrane subunit n=1 Tax=Plesiomonas shigelloides TaxID=703 RepID=UPI0012619E38|nr:efflux transporter outer membrane subunit [Plesiomonas shigelloides]KAB7686544.1 efflux transporter outer membrane subunit [Plesiomonas shigelloides]
MRRSIRHAVTLTVAGIPWLLSGCITPFTYEKPKVSTPAEWRVPYSQASKQVQMRWWEQFNDPVLTRLIQTALQQNLDLVIATQRIEEAAGKLIETRSDLYPQLGYGAGASRQRRLGDYTSTYQVGLTASWQLDLFGQLRAATEASKAQMLSAEEQRQAVLLTLVTQVANNYIQLLSLDQQLHIARSTAAAQQESLQIFRLQFKAGVISQLQLNQAESQYYQAQSEVPRLQDSIAQQENALSVLLGVNPQAIPRGQTLDGLSLPAIPADLPSKLLQQRPDIRVAEQNLVAAQANLAAARLAYFPTISLTGVLGSLSLALTDLLTGPAALWSLGAELAGPIFTAGSIEGQIQQASAQQQQLLAEYQKAIQNAFADANNALSAVVKIKEQQDTLQQQVDSLRSYARLARLSYDSGNTPYLEVLDAEQTLFTTELNQVQVQGQAIQSIVNVYAAMGGGWVTQADSMTVKGKTR